MKNKSDLEREAAFLKALKQKYEGEALDALRRAAGAEDSRDKDYQFGQAEEYIRRAMALREPLVGLKEVC